MKFGPFQVEARPRGRWNSVTHSYENVAPITGTVVLEIDIDDLVRELGARALLSKGGRAVEAGGKIRVVRK